jgi:hypothetical protein
METILAEVIDLEMDADDLLECLDDTDGMIDLEEDAVHINTKILAAALDTAGVIDLEDDDEPALNLDEFIALLDDDLELIDFEERIL